MDREHFSQRVKELREQGKTIRAIALELNVHRSRVERALKSRVRSTGALPLPGDQAQFMGGFASRVFVGRQQEMAGLKAALAAARTGKGCLVTLVGEPGIGKTRTAEELAEAARRLDVQVLWGRCPEERGAPAYWPWVQAIRSYVLDQEPDTIRSQMGLGAGDISQIVPEVQARLPDMIRSTPVEDPEQARFRLFDSIASFLKRASQERTLLLVLDNLHWADSTSLRLLEFVALELASTRLMLLCTYRDVDVSRGHTLFRTLGGLSRQDLYQRIILRGLNRDEVGQVMKAVGGVTLPRDLVATVHQQTEGNPLFVREVVRLLAEEELLVESRLSDLKGWDFRLPDSIREVIGRRLDRLSDSCNELLAIASVIGRDFSIGMLERLMGEPADRLLEFLEEALAARIIEEVASSKGHYRFSRALIRQTLAAELSTTQKVRLHARTAQVLEALYGADAPAHAAELAYHFAEAEAVAGSEKLVHYSLLAGQRALEAYAYEDALAHLRRALAAKEGDGTSRVGIQRLASRGVTDAETADLLFGMVRAQSATYQIEDALTSLGLAFDYYASVGNTERLVALACHTYRGSLMHLMTDIHRRALSLVPVDSNYAGRLLAIYGLSLGSSGNYQDAKEVFARALALARRQKDTTLEVRVLSNAAQVDAFHLRWRECLNHSLQTITLSGKVGDYAAMLHAHVWAGNALLQFGRTEEVRKQTMAALALEDKVHDRVALSYVYLLALMLSYLTGDFQAARGFSDRALDMDPGRALVLAWRAQIEYELGDFSRGSYFLNQLLDIPLVARRGSMENAASAFAIPMAARITGAVDRFDVAHGSAQAALSSVGVTPERAQVARMGLALMAVQRSDATSASEQYAHLRSFPGRMIRAGSITIAHILGLLAQTMSQPDLAVSHFEEAVAFCREAGCQAELAWTSYDYAALLCARRQQSKALVLLIEAQCICAELGMKPLLAMVNSLLGRIQDEPTARSPKYPAKLTERQVQILRLLAQGKTNREIAEELDLSERTVERHIAGVYAKIGSRNRAEATAFALSQAAIGN